MATVGCPVGGCTGTVSGYSRTSQMKYAAELEPFIDMIRHLIEVRDSSKAADLLDNKVGWDRDNLIVVANTGQSIHDRIHEATHGAMIASPDVKEWSRWKEIAVQNCIAAARVDKQWCIDYWAEQKRMGVKAPRELRGPMKKEGVAS